MSKPLFLIAGVAGLMMLLSPPPPHPISYPHDATYLRAKADVHEFCEADFAALCGPEQLEAMKPPRRLTTVLMDVSVVDETAGDHAPGPEAARLGLGGPKEEGCLRANYEALSKPCAASIALLDEAAAELPRKPRGPCPVMVGMALLGLLVFLGIVRKVRAKKRLVKKILDAIRSDADLKALVEAKAEAALPEPCTCGGRKCLKAALCAALVAVVLSFLVGPATVFFSAAFAAVVSKVVRSCATCCRAAKVADAPPDYEAVVEAPDAVAVDPAAAKVAADAALKDASAPPAEKPLEQPLL